MRPFQFSIAAPEATPINKQERRSEELRVETRALTLGELDARAQKKLPLVKTQRNLRAAAGTNDKTGTVREPTAMWLSW